MSNDGTRERIKNFEITATQPADTTINTFFHSLLLLLLPGRYHPCLVKFIISSKNSILCVGLLFGLIQQQCPRTSRPSCKLTHKFFHKTFPLVYILLFPLFALTAAARSDFHHVSNLTMQYLMMSVERRRIAKPIFSQWEKYLAPQILQKK